MSWIRYELGPQAMARYFSNNRPVWGMLYQLTTRLIPQVPLYWQLFALFWRWVTAALFWLLLRQLWPSREEMAFWASAFFLLYPGFNQQWVAYLYSHFFIVLSLFLFSLCAMFHALGSPKAVFRWHGVALLASALNLWMMEYFFFLELIRPFLLWVFLSPREEKLASRFFRLIKVFWPYGTLWGVAVLWRMFVFNNQVYQTSLLERLRSNFWPTLGQLLLTILGDVKKALIDGWLQLLPLPRPDVDGWRTVGMYWGMVVLAALTVTFFLWERRSQEMPSVAPLGIGFVALFLAGWPFWLAELEISLNFPASRFTLPFLFGSAIFLGGALSYVRRPLFRWGVAILLIALAVGRQFLWADLYRRDWRVHRTMFWQLSWRVPSLKPNTILLLNEGAFFTYADNSLSAALNWIYAPELQGEAIPYVLFYPTNRIGKSLPSLEPGKRVYYSFLAGGFQGSTSQVVAFYFQPPGCLRFLDAEIERENRMIPIESLMREALLLSEARWIGEQEVARLPSIYGPEPPHGWCYYFQKADLARQQKRWEEVAQLAEKAFRLQDHPNDPMEYFPFIEAYAHLGDWPRAFQLSQQAYRVSPRFVGPPLCRLWNRIDRELGLSQALRDQVHKDFGCFAE